MVEYKNAKAFRQALDARLLKLSKDKGLDNIYLRRIVAIDAFLARLQSEHVSFFLKGGYAMELRMAINRTTRDVDISYSSKELFALSEEQQQKHLLELLRNACSKDFGDFLVFKVSEPTLSIDTAYGGARFPVTASLDGKTFSSFGLDVIIGDNELEPTEKLQSNGLLAFAGIQPVEYRAISAEQQFAEKLHAYTNPGWQENTRVKDLIDMVLLINDGKLAPKQLLANVETIFKRRKTHELPEKLNKPPDSWQKPYKALAEQCKLTTDYLSAYEQVRKFIEPISGKRKVVPAAKREPSKSTSKNTSSREVILGKVAYIQDPDGYEIVMNRGSMHGVAEGQRFLVYRLGKNIRDPETAEDLGVLEIPKGNGVVTHVQERMSLLRCTSKTEPRRKVRISGIAASFRFDPFEKTGTEEETITAPLPFSDVKIGDSVRQILK